MNDATAGAPPPPSSSHGSRRLVVLCGVLTALLLAAVAAIVVLLASDDTGLEEGTADDYARAACDLLQPLPDTIDIDNLALDEPLLWQVQAIGALARAAGVADDDYASYQEAAGQLESGVARLDESPLVEGVDALRSECEENPPG